MEKSSKQSLKRRQVNEPPKTDTSAKTPARSRSSRSEDEESPYFLCSTQESRDDVDVLWDYNSPQQSRPKNFKFRKSKKRLDLQQQQQAPKVPITRHNSANNNDEIKRDFCKLREELKALKAEIAKPDHEESLILSPHEEAAFKYVSCEQQPLEEDFDDAFDDDMDEQLIMFSQQVEKEIEEAKNTMNSAHSSTTSHSNFQSDTYHNPQLKNVVQESSNTFNDSLDRALIDDDVFDQLTQVADIKQCKNASYVPLSDKNSKVLPRSVSENNVQISVVKEVTAGKVEWHRTHSFDTYTKEQLPQDVLAEIERKRLEAKARLEAKKRLEAPTTTSPICTDSSIVCSPDEIEKKRLQALAKLEAKKQQNLIERKKQEALKRREENRRKQATVMLSTRF